MSLTRSLRQPDSPVGRYVRGRFANVAPVAASWECSLAGSRTLRPRWHGQVDWTGIGHAFGHRLSLAFANTPPWPAILGARTLTATGEIVHRATRRFPVYGDFSDHPGGLRVLGDGSFYFLNDAFEASAGDGAGAKRYWRDETADALEAFFAELAWLVGRLEPWRTPPAPDAEATLLQACWALAELEDLYRGGPAARCDSRLYTGISPAELFVLGPGYALDDLGRLTRALYVEGLAQFRALGPGAVTVAPLFVEHWTDGDLIVSRCLVDVKTTVHPEFHPEWLHQLVAYALLDINDWYRLNRVAIYLARQARLVSWPLNQLLACLTSDRSVSIEQLRDEFEDVMDEELGDVAGAFDRWVNYTAQLFAPVDTRLCF